MNKFKQLIDYAATKPDSIFTYQASNMVLDIHGYASYINKLKARSISGGHNFLPRNSDLSPKNGADLNIPQIMKVVMSLANKSELVEFIINLKYAVPVLKTLEDMGHPHPPTPTQTENSTAYGVTNKNIHPKATKSIDTCFHWLRDRE